MELGDGSLEFIVWRTSTSYWFLKKINYQFIVEVRGQLEVLDNYSTDVSGQSHIGPVYQIIMWLCILGCIPAIVGCIVNRTSLVLIVASWMGFVGMVCLIVLYWRIQIEQTVCRVLAGHDERKKKQGKEDTALPSSSE